MSSATLATPRFLSAMAGMWWVFVSTGVLIPLLPRYVTHGIDAGANAVGVTIFVYGVAGVLARPLAAVYLRRRDPWSLMTGCVVVGALALAATPLAGSLAPLLVLRFVDGLAIGAFYTAAVTSVVRDVPLERRGAALSYFSVPLFLGSALGPVAGDRLVERLGEERTWIAAGVLLAVAAPFCLFGWTRARGSAGAEPDAGAALDPAADPARFGPIDLVRSVFHPSALVPGAVIVLVIAGWAAFQAYVPLYGPLIGLTATGTVFFSYSVVVLGIRVGGANLFDRLPLVEPAVVGAAANVAGLLVAYFWRRPIALYVAAVLMGVAVALMYTTLLRVALVGVPRREEAAVVGAYSVSYDIGAGAGAALLGLLATWAGSYRAIFVGGAVAGLVSLLIVITRLWPRRLELAAAARGSPLELEPSAPAVIHPSPTRGSEQRHACRDH